MLPYVALSLICALLVGGVLVIFVCRLKRRHTALRQPDTATVTSTIVPADLRRWEFRAWKLRAKALIHARREEYGPAEFAYRQALTLVRRSTNQKLIAEILCELANLLRWQWRYGEAVPLYEEALEMEESKNEFDERALASLCDDLEGCRQAEQRDYVNAQYQQVQALRDSQDEAAGQERAEEVLRYCRKKLGGDHWFTAGALCLLGCCKHDRGLKAEARADWQQALEILAEWPVVGRSTRETIEFNLALLKSELGF